MQKITNFSGNKTVVIGPFPLHHQSHQVLSKLIDHIRAIHIHPLIKDTQTVEDHLKSSALFYIFPTFTIFLQLYFAFSRHRVVLLMSPP